MLPRAEPAPPLRGDTNPACTVRRGCTARAHSPRLLSPNRFKRSEQHSNCRQMHGFDTVISPERLLNMPAKLEEVYSFCHLRSSAKGRGEGCKKKGGGGALCNFANRQFIHSKRTSEIRTQHKGGGGEEGKSSSNRNDQPYVITSRTKMH